MRKNHGGLLLTLFVAGCAATGPLRPVALPSSPQALAEPTPVVTNDVLDVGDEPLMPFEPVALEANAQTIQVRPHQPTPLVIRPGDTLFSLAREHLGFGGRWRELLEWNPQLDSDQLAAGDVVLIP